MPAGENLLECRQLDVRRRQIEIAGDLPDDIGERCRPAVALFDQGVVDGSLDLFFGDGQPDAAMALGVHIDQQGFMTQPGQTGRQIDACGGFPAAALLIDDRDGPHGAFLGEQSPWDIRADRSVGPCGQIADNGANPINLRPRRMGRICLVSSGR